MRKVFLLFTFLILTYSNSVLASLKCQNLFEGLKEKKYSSKEADVKRLYELYPNYKKLVIETLENIRLNEPNSGKPAQKFNEMSIYNLDPAIREVENTLSPTLKRNILAVYNALENKFMLIKYTKVLLEDAGVLMMKEADKMVLKRIDMTNPQSPLSKEKITKRHYLEMGQVDHNSLRRILTDRILSRGDKMSVILKKEHGSYNKNKTRNYNHEDFFGVLRIGPFFDLEFKKGQDHGQDVHLLQMDFVEQVLTDRHEFWRFVVGATPENRQGWAWSLLFDGFDYTYRHPEFVGPVLRKTLPVY